jgi:NitT/TauT family transport system substrate-binding protein
MPRIRNVRRRNFAASLAALAVARAALQPADAQTAPFAMQLGSNAADDVTPVLWAQHSGMFAKAGLSIDIQKFTSGSAVTAAVVGGALDIGKSSLLPLISARNHGVPLKLIAPGEIWLSEAPISGMVVLKDSPIVSAKDLNGKIMPTPSLRDIVETSSRAWIDANGGDSKTVRFVELPSAAVLAALLDGRVAAATLSNPYFGNVAASGKVRILSRPEDAIAKRFMITAWFATEAYIEKNREPLARYVQIIQQAATYTNAHHAETVPVTAPFWGLEPAVLAGMTRSYVGAVVDVKDIQPVIDAALKYGIIDKPLDAQQMISAVALRPAPTWPR